MKHLTRDQRCTISVLLQSGVKQKDIASAINKDKSLISRELRRNCDKRSQTYEFDLAQRKYEKRQKSKRKHIRFTQQIKAEVDLLLEQKCLVLK
jgi:IS30 family transposase